MKKIFILILLLLLSAITFFTVFKFDVKQNNDYGVFLSIYSEDIDKLDEYKTVVIDAQNFTKEDIDKLHKENKTVYSYLNIGSVENYRDYYNEYQDLFLGTYENWEEEQWVDVSSKRWQEFILSLSDKFDEMGIDGYFIDNTDVYYNFPEDKIYDGLTNILTKLISKHKEVIINGGDYYVDKFYEENKSIKEILTGINQETVFSKIDFDNNKLLTQTISEQDYYLNYINKYKKEGAKIFLLEYTTDKAVINKIIDYCNTNGCLYYISDSIELD